MFHHYTFNDNETFVVANDKEYKIRWTTYQDFFCIIIADACSYLRYILCKREI